jgi:SAM-dependent methyltransferase
MDLGYGWLSYDPDLPDDIAGVHVEREATKTRVEEYTFVDRKVCVAECTRALDAATGYVVDWHMLPYMLAARGCAVETIDADVRTLDMPFHHSVNRQVANIAALPFEDGSFDLVTCISTLEHCSPEVRLEFSREAARVLISGGILIVTADNYPGVSPEALADLFKDDFDIGKNHGDEDRRFPGGKRVAYLVGRRKV